MTEETYLEMKKLIAEYEEQQLKKSDEIEKVIVELPYLEAVDVEINQYVRYNPKYGDNRECECGHSYYRHFDSYEQMDAVGCKYCECYNFIEAKSIVEPKCEQSNCTHNHTH
jgi:hypothetical protein